LYSLIALAWGLRLHNLASQELWFDEAASYFIAAKPPHGIVAYVAQAPFEHPPLYYVVLHFCMALFGKNEWALRFPSVLLGTVFIAGLWRAATVLRLDASEAVAAAAIAALSPFLITYSQEARMYTLLQCLGLAATALLLVAMKARQWWLWLMYGALVVVGLLTHYFFAFLIPVHLLTLVVVQGGRSRAVKGFLLLSLSVLAAGTMWVATASGPRQAALRMWHESLWGSSPEAVGQLFLDWAYGGAVISHRPKWAVAAAIALAVLAAAGLVARNHPRRQRLILLVWAVIPPACAIVIPYGGLALRHFSYIAAALCFLTASGLVLLYRKHKALGVLATVLLGGLLLPGIDWQYSVSKGNYGEAMTHIAKHRKDGDYLLLINPHQWVLRQYYDQTGLPASSVSSTSELSLSDMGATRIWAVFWESWALEDAPQIEGKLHSELHEAERIAYSPNLSLKLFYVPSNGGPRRVTNLAWGSTNESSVVRVAEGVRAPGDAALVTWCRATDTERAQDQAIVLRLTDSQGHVWAERIGAPAQDSSSESGSCSRQALLVPGGTPPGHYRLEMGVVDVPSGATLPAFTEDGLALGPSPVIGDITVARASYPLPTVVSERKQRLQNGLTYLGTENHVQALLSGQKWEGTLQFKTSRPLGEEIKLRVSLLSHGGNWPLGEVALRSGELLASEWLPHEAWRCPYEFRLPNSLPTQEYSLVAQVIDNGQVQLLADEWLSLRPRTYLVLDRFTVTQRQANIVDQVPSHEIDASFGGSINLYGYDLTEQEGQLELQLYWRCVTPTAEPYKVFVHLTETGSAKPLDQDDAPPSQLSTDAWIAGDNFVSFHRLQLPEARQQPLELRVGLYSERTMLRLGCDGAACSVDHVLLPVVR